MRQSRKKWERRREVHRNKLAAVIFVIMMIAFCVVNLATGDREFSATENRALEQRQELTISGIESGRWMEQYESYVSDQFAGREENAATGFIAAVIDSAICCQLSMRSRFA